MDEHRGQAASHPSIGFAPPSSESWQRPQPHGWAPEYAGFWRRFLAGVVDGLVVGFAYNVLSFVLGIVLDFIAAFGVDAASGADSGWQALVVWLAASLVMVLVLDWLYCAGLESSAWRATLGKRALGIVVTDLAGDRISFGRATGRHFAEYVSGITLGIGYLIQPFTARRQALHDLIAGTLVVRV